MLGADRMGVTCVVFAGHLGRDHNFISDIFIA